MGNKKKLKSRDGATRITPDKSVGYFCGMYKLQAYDKNADQWSDIDGCTLLTWTEATTARKNYVSLRQACKVANSSTMNIKIPSNEVNGN